MSFFPDRRRHLIWAGTIRCVAQQSVRVNVQGRNCGTFPDGGVLAPGILFRRDHRPVRQSQRRLLVPSGRGRTMPAHAATTTFRKAGAASVHLHSNCRFCMPQIGPMASLSANFADNSSCEGTAEMPNTWADRSVCGGGDPGPSRVFSPSRPPINLQQVLSAASPKVCSESSEWSEVFKMVLANSENRVANRDAEVRPERRASHFHPCKRQPLSHSL